MDMLLRQNKATARHPSLVVEVTVPLGDSPRQETVQAISVIGLGKLGSPMAACFAARGSQVHAVDIDPGKVHAINNGVAPVHEPGLSELLRESSGFLKASVDAEAAVRESEATFVIVAPQRTRRRFILALRPAHL
jgi:UDP-N-acetyl-D-mannosaminuronate dehydrogenase